MDDGAETRRVPGALAALNKAVLDTMPDGVVILDRDRELLYANPTAFELIGNLSLAGGEDAPSFLDPVTDEALPPERLPIARLLDGESLADVVVKRTRPGQGPLWLSISGRPVFDREGHAWAAFAVIRDVTLTRQVEAELGATAERFRVALAGSRIVVSNQDAELRYTWVYDATDPGASRILGLTDDDILSPSDAAAMRAIKQRVLETGEPFSGTVAVHSPGGRRSFDLRLEPRCSESGQIVGLTAAAIDVTDRERDLERLAAAQAEAEAANRAKDDFVALVSHELRNPVSPIRIWTRVLRRVRHDDAQFEHILLSIERNTDTLVRLIDDLLDTSRVLTGKLRLELRPVELRALLASVIEGFHPTLVAQRLELRTSLPETEVVVMGDHARLQQVAWNLLSNAIKFTPPGGSIELTLAVSGGTVEFSVSDTGQGIPPDLLPRVFQRYQQGRTEAAHLGLGLGLSISQHIVEVHGGALEAVSAGVGQGACFTVRLPIVLRKFPGLGPDAAVTDRARGPSRGHVAW